jgi:uncharacterized lipoprotein YddW (UPF0748 family)
MRTLLVALLVLACDPVREPSVVTPGCPMQSVHLKRQLRGAWIASVTNIDWPSRAGMSAAEQMAEFRQLADEAQRMHLNALFVQIRPTADAFYPSQLEPWSQWLTGTQGQDPGYDPLGFIVDEAHARNLELHAWFNPYRVSLQADPNMLAANHMGRQHPDWLRVYGGKMYFDPGIPDVRAFIEQVVLDVVTKYDVDGVHFDDYFYPYPVTGATFYDDDTFARYGAGMTNKDDWRRGNIDMLISELYTQIHTTKPWVRFGISPFGIWRNQMSDPGGSATHGLESYSATYSDSRAWIVNHWIDYIVPQVYWNIGFSAAAYDVLVPWWDETVGETGVQLYIGEATYRIGGAGQQAGWQDPHEMLAHLDLDAQNAHVGGQVFFSMTSLLKDPLRTTDLLLAGPYARPALAPEWKNLGGRVPGVVTIENVQRTHDGVEVTFTDAPGEQATAYYAIYRFDGVGPIQDCNLATADHLLTTVRKDGAAEHKFFDGGTISGKSYTYVITAVNRLHLEGPRSVPRSLQP